MERIFSSKDQILLFLMVFSLIVLLFAVLVDKSNGLFLARNPWNTESYKASSENEVERKAGRLFVKLVYRGVSVLIPACLFLYSGVVAKVLVCLFIVGIFIYQKYLKKYS